MTLKYDREFAVCCHVEKHIVKYALIPSNLPAVNCCRLSRSVYQNEEQTSVLAIFSFPQLAPIVKN